MHMIDPAFSVSPPPPAGPSGLDMRRLLRRVLRGLPIICLFCLLGTAGGYALLKNLPAKYPSSVSILIDPKQPGGDGAATEFGSAFVDNSKISSVEIVLQSSNLLRQVAAKLHLADDHYYGDAQPSRLSAMLLWVTGGKPLPITETPRDREDRAVGRLWQSVHPARIGATYVIRVDVTAPTPKLAADIAGAVADAYLDGIMNSKWDAARRDAEWLAERLKTQRDQLMKSEAQVTAVQQKFGLVGTDAKDDTAVDRQSVEGVNQQLIGVTGDVAAIRSRYEAAAALQKSGGDPQALQDVANSPVFQNLQERQAEATQRLATLSARYSSDYPAVKQAAREAATLKTMIATETRRIINGLKTQADTALARETALKAQMDRLVGKVTATANAQGLAELREAQRLSDSNRIAYEALLSKLRQVEEQGSRLDVEARIISAPDFADSPSFPRGVQILPAGGFLGFLFGLGIVLAWPWGQRKVESAAEVERDFALAVLGTVPYLAKSKLRHNSRPILLSDYVRVFPFSPCSEAIRLLRYRILGQKKSGSTVIQVTSSVPGEGKSTIAACLAISASMGDIRTVLVDLDLHRPGATRQLLQGGKPGVVDLLLGTATLESTIQPIENLPIALLSAGTVQTLRPGLIEKRELADLIAKLRRSYDLIIIDSPPILAVSDPVYISRFVDSTLLVVAWRDTPSSSISKAIEILRVSSAPLAGALFNKVIDQNRLTYGPTDYGYSNKVAVEQINPKVI